MATRRRPQVEVLRQHEGAHRLIPAGVLVLGLCVVAAVVASRGRLSPAALHEIEGTVWELHPVGGGAHGFKYLPYSPFSTTIDHRSWLLTIVLTTVYLGSATAIGSILVDVVRGEDRWPRPVSAVAGFLPGYVMMLAPLQLLFAAVPVGTASWIALAAAPIAAVALHRRVVVATVRHRGPWRTPALVVGGVLAMVALTTVHRLEVGLFFLTQDSIQWFVSAAVDQVHGRLGHYLAQWDQQSDEWTFNAPLMFSAHRPGDVWFPIYATQCVSLASFLALVFGIVHRLARRRKTLAGAAAAGALFGFTPAIYPWVHVSFIAGGQSLSELGHPGRQVGIVAPWFALLVLRRHRRAVTVALGCAVVGLGFTTINGVLGVLAAVAVSLAWRAVRGRGVAWRHVGRLRSVAHLSAVLAPAAVAGAFWWMHQTHTPADAAWVLVAAAAIALVGAVAVAAMTGGRREPVRPARAAGSLAAWSGAVVAGLLLSNNLTYGLLHDRARDVLGDVLPGYHGPLLYRTGEGSPGGDLLAGLSFPKLSADACGAFFQCRGLADFLAAFGVLFVAVLVTWVALGPITTDATANVRRGALLLMVAALGLGLTAVYFTGAPSVAQAIIFSRFLEVPYYGLIALVAMMFAESRNRVTMATGIGMLALWTVIPLIAAQWPEQMVRNAGWYLQRLGVL